MKTMTTISVKTIALALALLGAMTPAFAEQKVTLKDPVKVEIENWRGKAFYEILFMNRQADGSGVGFYHNSLGLDLEASNEEMDARFRALDADTLMKEYGGDGVIFNGPRRLVANSITGIIAWDGGKQKVIGTVPYRILGLFETPDLDKAATGELPAYHVLTSKRTNSFRFNAGETVYELITPEGAVYTMFSLSLRIDPNNTIENLPTLGDRLKNLPEGWKFRSRKLDKEMILTSTVDSEPPNTIVLDEFVGNYQYNAEASQQTSPAVPNILGDGDGAKTVRFENLHQTRFIELFFGTKDPKTGKLVAPCFNTAYTSNKMPASKDTAPQALVESLDLEKLAKEYGVAKVMLNGPKLWMPDWVEVAVGTERNFNGMTAGWVAQLDLPESGKIDGATWGPMQIARASKIAWTKGTKVALLDDADGNTWVLKGFQLGLNPQQTWEEYLAKGAANYKTLPAGWKFRVKTLEKDLIEIPDNNLATIMSDELLHVWDKTGPGMTNYKP